MCDRLSNVFSNAMTEKYSLIDFLSYLTLVASAGKQFVIFSKSTGVLAKFWGLVEKELSDSEDEEESSEEAREQKTFVELNAVDWEKNVTELEISLGAIGCL